MFRSKGKGLTTASSWVRIPVSVFYSECNRSFTITKLKIVTGDTPKPKRIKEKDDLCKYYNIQRIRYRIFHCIFCILCQTVYRKLQRLCKLLENFCETNSYQSAKKVSSNITQELTNLRIKVDYRQSFKKLFLNFESLQNFSTGSGIFETLVILSNTIRYLKLGNKIHFQNHFYIKSERYYVTHLNQSLFSTF